MSKVFCKDCSFWRSRYGDDYCIATPDFEYDPVIGPSHSISCRERNKNFDCQYFKRRARGLWEYHEYAWMIVSAIIVAAVAVAVAYLLWYI